MGVKIELSPVFGRYTRGQLEVEVHGTTVRECISDLVSRFPEIRKVILDKDGNLGNSYDIFINGESAYPSPMDRSVKDGDKLNIVLMIYGG